MNDECAKKMKHHQNWGKSHKYCANKHCMLNGQLQIFASENYCVICGKPLISTDSLEHDMSLQYE